MFAIGDIHGRADLLAELLDRIREVRQHRAAPEAVVVFLGDYVDRSEQSRAVIDLLLSDPLPDFETVHLMGNHEIILLDFLDDYEVARGWLQYGGDATLMSYGLKPRRFDPTDESLRQLQAEFRRVLPKPHLSFLQNLQLSHVEGDFAFVHAGIRPGVALDDQVADDLLWIRGPFLSSDADFGQVVIHGHTITDDPEIRHNRIGIDTGAFATGRLTCLVLEDDTQEFLST